MRGGREADTFLKLWNKKGTAPQNKYANFCFNPFMKIISGGQTGVDRAALDAAIALGLEYGGWIPKGRLAEDGKIPSKYKLQECGSPDYPVRTEMNVKEADATLILCRGQVRGGTQYTHFLCLKHKKPVGLVSLDSGSKEETVDAVRAFLDEERPKVLNVAGPRESNAPGIHEQVLKILCEALKR